MTPLHPSAEAQALDACLAYLRQRFGPGYALARITLHVHGPDSVCSVTQIKPAVALPVGPTSQPTAPDPNDLRAQIERVLTDSPSPLKGRAIARRVNRSFTSYFREVLADLRSKGKLVLTGGGYWLSGRPVPTDSQPGGSGD